MPASTPATADGHQLNAVADPVDLRDRYYEPALIELRSEIPPPPAAARHILDQGAEGACTGFGLAAVINQLYARAGRPVRVSARMLYEMAKRHDTWAGEDYEGSSCRGAIKGWYNMGVCREELWPYGRRPGHLTVERARDAFNHTIGAYYRVRPDVVDFHAALNEVGAIYASARVHAGWNRRQARGGRIPLRQRLTGGHAFAIVGYNAEGFWVQNSWGESWGDGGVALWSYEDWKQNIFDAWVFRSALPTPQIFPGRRPAPSVPGDHEASASAPVRNEIMGHFVHLDDGHLHPTGRYWSTLDDVRETARLLAASTKYQHLLLYAHGGLNSVRASARRIKALKDVFKANGIYPLHFMYDTGLTEELRDVILRREGPAGERMGGFFDLTDTLLETLTRVPGRAVWREMKRGAARPFARRGDDGTQVLKVLRDALVAADSPLRWHVAGHSTGAILQAHLLQALHGLDAGQVVHTCSLLAPAASVALFESHFRPLLEQGSLKELTLYNLNRKLERDDHVAGVYRKSLLWLVSRAFEENRGEPLLGMARYSEDLDFAGLPVTTRYSAGPDGGERRTRARSHGGFDNDPATMNDLLTRILGQKPGRPFTAGDLVY